MRAALCLTAFLILTAAAQDEPKIQRDGPYYVRKVNGTLAFKPSGRLRIFASGKLTVRGDDRGSGITYTWIQRVKAPDARSAARLFEYFAINTKSSGEWAILASRVPEVLGATGDLTIHIPKKLKQTVLENQSGAIWVDALAGDVTAECVAGEIEMNEIGGSVVAQTGGGNMTFGRVGGSLRCISGGGSIRVDRVGAEAVLETAGGEINVREALGPLRASTAGNIYVEAAKENVYAHTSSGLIDIGKAGGIVTAESIGGAIQIGYSAGVRCESANGSIRIKGGTGALRASTANGNILTTLQSAVGLQDSLLTTGRGDITVYIPSNLAVTVKALNEAAGVFGRIISEFSEIKIREGGWDRERVVTAEGRLNGGGPVLMVSATRGTIFLKRQR